MQPVKGLGLRVAAVLVGSAVIGTCIATNPATAQDVNSMLGAIGLTTCSSSTPCKKYKNNGSGAGLEGIGGNGNGLIAQSTNGSATFSTSTNADGVQAYSLNNDGTNSGTNNNSSINSGRSGVWGHDDSTDGGQLNVGVAGSSNYGIGVSGSSSNLIGVQAFSATSAALNAVAAGGDIIEPIQVIGGTANTLGLSFAAFDSNLNNTIRFDNVGNAFFNGQIFTAGLCNSGCSPINKSPGNRIISYTPHESIPTMEDVGIAQLVNGQAVVRLDAAFANVIDNRAIYMVFITPEGQSRGLYVAHKSATEFIVAENDGGRSTIAFDYRIVAKPFGVNAKRLPILDAMHAEVAVRPGSAPLHH
jgi:hypothetical protein